MLLPTYVYDFSLSMSDSESITDNYLPSVHNPVIFRISIECPLKIALSYCS